MALTWEPDFSQGCSFCRMLTNHNNFCFTQIRDKTNDMIFLKSPKILFLGHFLSFLPDGDFFQKNQALSHITIYGPLTPCKFQKKIMSQFWENLWTDRRTDGWTLFYRTLKKKKKKNYVDVGKARSGNLRLHSYSSKTFPQFLIFSYLENYALWIIEITKDVKFVKTDISGWLATNRLLSRWFWKVKPKYLF